MPPDHPHSAAHSTEELAAGPPDEPSFLSSLQTFRDHARQRLVAEQPSTVIHTDRLPERGDHVLNNLSPEEYAGLVNLPSAVRPAAVLIPLIAGDAGLNVILTRRTPHLPSHGGQIAFPGGKIDADDDGPRSAALREASEEIGLPRDAADVMGYLDSYQTGSGFRIFPVVALVRDDTPLTPEPGEVAEIFQVPLAFLIDRANHQRHSRWWRGASRTYFAMPYGRNYIWGATAGILRNLSERLHP